jgi:ankyrin repeat protein
MLAAVLDNDARNLERLVFENVHHINDPIGLPFDIQGGRFIGHPSMDQMLIQQHPEQTLFDIACAMPCGPIVWILLAYGAKGSKHPVGTDLALHNAIKNKRVYTVQALLVPGRSDIEGPGSPWTPLLQAVFWNIPEVVRILLSRGARVNNGGLPGSSTALHVCLSHRKDNYSDLSAREKCHEILEMLLSAGADVHVTLTHPVIHSTFDMFIEPWRTNPFWAIELSPKEIDCLCLFMSKDINFEVSFQGCPCASARSKTFIHQVLWHSTPSVARHFVDSFIASSANDGSILLHEILDLCPNAKRHLADTLRDIQVLLGKGVNPNLADASGLTPLRRCLEQCPPVDLVAQLHVLLNGGADPEAEDSSGSQPYILAARTLKEPLRSEVMSVLVAKVPGRHARRVNGVTHTWAAEHFPIPETQAYSQVMSCMRQTDGFMLNMRNMVPGDVQMVFQRAYVNVVSKNFLNTMTRVAQTNLLDSKEKSEVLSILSMRRGLDLTEYKFDQGLVEALLDLQPTMLEPSTEHAMLRTSSSDTMSTTELSPSSTHTVMASTTPLPKPAHAPFQFNSNNPTTTIISNPSPSPKSPQWLGDFFIAPTTQIRWRDPCDKQKLGDTQKATAAVLAYKCETCDDGKLLTKKELERHQAEHEHSEACVIERCTRRFCCGKTDIRDRPVGRL